MYHHKLDNVSNTSQTWHDSLDRGSFSNESKLKSDNGHLGIRYHLMTIKGLQPKITHLSCTVRETKGRISTLDVSLQLTDKLSAYKLSHTGKYIQVEEYLEIYTVTKHSRGKTTPGTVCVFDTDL